MTGSATFYARANILVAGGSTSSLQQQTTNSTALANKANQKWPAVDVEANRFAGAALEGFVGQVYSLRKD
ncbi:hypothetical protein BG015_006412 [Linnemannia schmuckeri]|uniref:Uncharacterized protein n=1 Tax=Linnemannia schmuckeri TaxID=64567 RepID=A0A9P5RZY0_9FUNG|nr:hypothetical protein BG015_006412 [Linnemannia schmuckeri]